MTFIYFLLAWANSPYTIAAGIALLFAAMQWSGLLGLLAGGDHDGADGHGDADAHGDLHGDHDFDHGADHAGDHGGDPDADHDAEANGTHSVASSFAGVLGLGKIPLSILWQTYAIVFAVAGLSLHSRYLGYPKGPPLGALLFSLPLSVLAGLVTIAILSRVLGPVFSSKDQDATSRTQLVGHVGVVISSKVTRDFGEIRVRDKNGYDLRLICRLADGSRAVSEHKKVVIVEVAPTSGQITVAPLDDEDETQDVAVQDTPDERVRRA